MSCGQESSLHTQIKYKEQISLRSEAVKHQISTQHKQNTHLQIKHGQIHIQCVIVKHDQSSFHIMSMMVLVCFHQNIDQQKTFSHYKNMQHILHRITEMTK